MLEMEHGRDPLLICNKPYNAYAVTQFRQDYTFRVTIL